MAPVLRTLSISLDRHRLLGLLLNFQLCSALVQEIRFRTNRGRLANCSQHICVPVNILYVLWSSSNCRKADRRTNPCLEFFLYALNSAVMRLLLSARWLPDLSSSGSILRCSIHHVFVAPKIEDIMAWHSSYCHRVQCAKVSKSILAIYQGKRLRLHRSCKDFCRIYRLHKMNECKSNSLQWVLEACTIIP